MIFVLHKIVRRSPFDSPWLLNLLSWPPQIERASSAGEPLNPEVVRFFSQIWKGVPRGHIFQMDFFQKCRSLRFIWAFLYLQSAIHCVMIPFVQGSRFTTTMGRPRLEWSWVICTNSRRRCPSQPGLWGCKFRVGRYMHSGCKLAVNSYAF